MVSSLPSQSTTTSLRKIALDTIGLQTPAGRLLFFAIVSIAIFLVPYAWLANLSIWQYLNIPSPSIGLTRSYWLVLHGDFEAAWVRNKLIYLVLFIGLPLLVIDVIKITKTTTRAR